MSSMTLSQTFGFSWADYVAMFLSSFGIFTNLINILVFFSSSLKDTTYHYMLVKSFINLIYLIFTFLNAFFIFCSYCPQTLTYFSNLYAIVISFYLSGSLAIMRILIEIAISLRIFNILINRMWLSMISYKVVICTIILFSIVFYAEKPFCFNIIQIPEYNIFYLVYSDFGRSKAHQMISIAKEMIRMILTVVVLTIINIFNLVYFRRRYKIRHIGVQMSLPTQEPTNKNPTTS